jgi:hypothetical protein
MRYRRAMRAALVVVMIATACGGGSSATATTTPTAKEETRPPVAPGPVPPGVSISCWHGCHAGGDGPEVCTVRCPVDPSYDPAAHQAAVDYEVCMTGCMDEGGTIDDCDAECE